MPRLSNVARRRFSASTGSDRDRPGCASRCGRTAPTGLPAAPADRRPHRPRRDGGPCRNGCFRPRCSPRSLDGFSMQPCQAQMPSVRLKIAVVGTGGVSDSDPPKRAVLFVGAAAAGHLIDAPGVGRLRAGRKRTAERDHRAHAIRHHLGELARVEAAEAPADQADLAAMGVVEFPHQIDHRVLHALAQAEIAALAPAADRIAAVLQEAAQRARRDVGGDQPGSTSTGWPSPLGARLSSGKAPRKAPNSWMARALPETSGFWTAGEASAQ